MTLAFAAEIIGNDDFSRTRDHDLLALGIRHVTHIAGLEANGTGRLGFDGARHGGTRRSTADVEGTHGELRTRLTDGLRSNHADRLADGDARAPTQIAPIAGAAQTVTR